MLGIGDNDGDLVGEGVGSNVWACASRLLVGPLRSNTMVKRNALLKLLLLRRRCLCCCFDFDFDSVFVVDDGDDGVMLFIVLLLLLLLLLFW